MNPKSVATQANQRLILIVQDDPKLAERISLDCQSQGYKTTIVSDSETAITQLKRQQPALAIIDQPLSEQSGFQLCRQLRASGAKIPLLILLSDNLLADRIDCLESGADDYILKPYQGEVLLQRLGLYLPTANPASDQGLTFQDLTLDLATRQAHRASRPIELTMKEFELLKYLMEHPREVLTREQILDRVWGFDFRGESNVIEVYIRYLRLKVQINTEKRLIHTVRGVGYVLRES